MKRGVNLGCGTVCLPCERPYHHAGLPEELYTDTDIVWDNVDRNVEKGVTHQVDLFTYPWALPSNTYDVAIAAHLVEHIPHHIIWNGDDWGEYRADRLSPASQELVETFGQVIPNHPLYQDGWFAWFSELWRIMKPSGQAYILVPYAWSHAGISDPTHTRYLTQASFNYFNNATDVNPMFRYRMEQLWNVDIEHMAMSPHEIAVKEIEAEAHMDAVLGWHKPKEYDLGARVIQMSHRLLNTLVDIMVRMEAVKDEAISEKRPEAGESADRAGSARVDAQSVGDPAISIASAGAAD